MTAETIFALMLLNALSMTQIFWNKLSHVKLGFFTHDSGTNRQSLEWHTANSLR